MTVHLPNVFIVGSAKSGTSSLYQYLKQHPAVFMSRIKEPHYLCSDCFPERFTGPGDEGFSDNIVRNREAYLELFENPGEATILGEASVYYLNFPDSAERIKALNPDAKIIAVLREPVSRAFSAYLHTTRDGRETLSFELALKVESERIAKGYQPLWWYQQIGYYSQQVRRYLEVFDPSQIRIFLYEDLKDTERVLQEVFKFLDIPPDIPVDTSIRYNVSGVPKSRWIYNFFAQPNPLKSALKPFFPTALRQRLGHQAKAMTLQRIELRRETRTMLQERYRDDIHELEQLLDRDLSHWLK